MKKRIISLLLVFALLATLLPTGAMAVETAKDSGTNPFTDVKSTDWFYDAVRYAGEKGFFSGTSATTFEPYDTMTRGMFVTVLGRMAGVNAGDYTGATGFSDVPETAYYAPYVAWAARYGITGGTGDGKFSPNAFINRQQMAAFFVRYFEAFDVKYETGANITTTPADLDTVAPYARDAVLKLWKQGLLNGDGVNFSPTGSATRAQASTLCMRTDKTVPVWYSAPGVEGRTGGAASTAPTKPEQKPGNSSGSSSSGGSSSGGGSTGGGTTTTTYYAVKFELGKDQPATQLPGERTVAAGTPISSLPTPSKPGVVFLGWYYDKEMTRPVGAGDQVNGNMTLYASIAGEELQSIETPNYVTKTDVEAGDFSFGVTGGNTLKFINVTGGNIDVVYTVSGSTVTATLEAGQTYKVELLDENARFVLDGAEQDTSVRVLNILTKKAEVKNAELNKDVKKVDVSATEGLKESVFKGLYQIDDTGASTRNTTSGTFTYKGEGTLTEGQTLAVTEGTVNLDDVTSDSGKVAYIKITGVNGGDSYSYEMADVEDVLFIPDVLPIQNSWYTGSSENTVTISAENLSTALHNVDAAGLDVGDFLAFINGEYSKAGTANSYGRVTNVSQSGEDYVITYAAVTEGEVENALQNGLDVYYQKDKDIEVTEEDKKRIENDLKNNIKNSSYPAEAASYVMAVMEESGGLDTAPDPAAVAAYMDTISTYARADGSIVLYAGDQKAEAKVDWSRFRVSIDGWADHLNGRGFDIQVTVPITLEMGSVTVDFTAVFEEEVILGQSISTKRHKIGFLKYDYSLNASFDIGNYTGIHFKAEIKTEDGGNDESLSKKLDEILDKMEEYGGLLESGGVSGTDGTMESLSDIYKEVMGSASDSWVDVINQQLFDNSGSAFLHIFCWQIKGSFVVSVNMAVAMGMDFEYTTRKRYNFSVRVKAKTSTNETIDLITPNYTFNFYVIGTIGVRAGLRLEMYVGLISLKIDRIGIVAEVGVYTQLWGYFFYHLEWKQGAGKKSNSAGALLIEIGMYLDIKFVATLFNSSKLTWAPTIYANQWPLWSAGQRQNVFAFSENGRTYDFKTVKTLALPGSTYTMQSMDLKTGVIGAVNKDDNSESAFNIAFTNPHFSYNAATNTVTVKPAAGSLNEETDMVITWKKAAMAFTSKPIQKTLHIKWSDPAGMRYISFHSMGGSAVAQITGGEGAAITWPANPTKQGYTFAGWYTNPSVESSKVEKKDTMPKFFGTAKGMLLFAKWVPAEVDYTVEHYQQELNGTYKLKETEKARGITGTWTKENRKNYEGFRYVRTTMTTIAADGSTVTQVYYDREKYTVTWKPQNGTEDIVQAYKYGAELNTPTVGRAGYKFDGWYTDKDAEFKTTTTVDGKRVGVPVSENLTLHAKWKGDQYTVTLNVNGGDALSGDSTRPVTYGQPYGELPAPTRTGYTFAGWYTEKDGGTKVETDTVVQAVEDHELFAHWTANTYTVTFEPMDGTLADEQKTKTVIYNSRYGELPKPTLQGYDFVGWYTAKGEDGKKVDANTCVETAGEHTLYAHWTEGTVTYTVKHLWQNVENDEYTEHETETPSGTAMTEVTATPKTYTGFTCVTSGDELKATVKPDGTTVIEIKYDRLTYTVKWMNGETLLKTDTSVKYGATPTRPDENPTKSGTDTTVYEFTGWNTAADGSNPMPDKFTVTGDVTFYAQFDEAPRTYKITYQNMGGAKNPNPDSYTYGTAVTLDDPTRTGYAFNGWYTDSDATGDRVTGISDTEFGNKILYAKWTANTYTITLNAGQGTLPDGQKTLNVTYGKTYSLPTPTPPDSNYEFEGWYQGNKAFENGGTYQVDGNITLTAKWVVVHSKTTTYDGFSGPIELYIGGQQINSNGGNIPGVESVVYNESQKTYTLTLFGYTYNETEGPVFGGSDYQPCAVIYYKDNENALDIELKGVNTIVCTAPRSGGDAIGVYINDLTGRRPVTIRGSGTLDVTANGMKSLQVHGILTRGNLTIEGGAVVNAKGNMYGKAYTQSGSNDCYGIYTQTLTINGAEVNAKANILVDGAYSFGISASSTRIRSGSLTALGGTSAYSSSMIQNMTLGNDVTAVVSTSTTGRPATDYNEKMNLREYKYFHASSNP